MKNEDSSGGSIECVIQNMPAGIGEPVFEKLSANLGKAILSIGAVKAFEIGDGTAVAHALGHTNTTSIQGIRMERSSSLPTTPAVSWAASATEVTSFACIRQTDAFDLKRTVHHYKRRRQQTDFCKGRHDPVIVPRAVVVVESMAAITLVDMLMCSITSNMTNLERFFRK